MKNHFLNIKANQSNIQGLFQSYIELFIDKFYFKKDF